MPKVVRYRYLPRQYDFFKLCRTVRHAAYIGGFGSGKTHVLNIQALIEAQRKSYGLIGAPTYRMLEDTTRRKFFQLCPEQWIADFTKSSNKVTLINGSEIIFRALESPERLTNLEVDWFGLDEIGEVKLDTFRMLQGRLRKPGGSHHGFGVGNPAGPAHWTYEYFVLKAKQYPESYGLVQATSHENTFIDKAYTEEMAKSFGEDSLYYKRFVLGQFVAFEGAYWANFDVRPYPEGHVCKVGDIEKILKPKTSHPWRYGKVLDFGYEHPWVLMWYVTDGETIVFYDEYYARHRTIREHLREIRRKEEIHLRDLGVHRASVAWTDHDAQDRAEIENCYDEDGTFLGFQCNIADKDVMKGILHVQTLFERRRLFITDRCVNAYREIPSYRAKSKDRSDKEQPIKENDDTCDCIRMAAWMELRHVGVFARSPEEFAINPMTDIYGEISHYGPKSLDTWESMRTL